MKKKIAISIILTLLMVVSTFNVGTAKINTSVQNNIEVEKTVYDGSEWVDSLDAEVGDILTFNITISYHSNCPQSYMQTDISVKDILPDCLEFRNNCLIEYGSNTYSGITAELGQTLYWNLTDAENTWLDEDISLWDISKYPSKEESVTIFFDVEVVGNTELNGEENVAEVTAWETCCNWDVYGEDTATVIVEEPEQLGISIEKEIYDEDLEGYIDDSEGAITVYNSENVEFRINVTNTGNVDLEDVVVKDVLPEFLIFNSASDSPSYDGDLNLTWTFDLNGGETKYLYVYMNVPEEIDEVFCGENYVNVTAVEPDCVCDCECLYDEDSLEICAKPHIIVEKKVWDGNDWADKIDHVVKSENVEFKITTTYYGERTMKCLLVFDDLPECLKYVKTTSIIVAGEEISIDDIKVYIGDGEIKEICGNEFILPDGNIIWDWIDTEFALKDGETVEIIFETEVTEYCESCDCIECQESCWDENCAMSVLWGCCPCTYYMDEDCVDVMCCPPPTTFEKKVREKGENKWKDSIETTVGGTLEFKLELEYYGENNLTDISFKDELPCILEYASGTARISVIEGNAGSAGNMEPAISSDGKTLWWNLTNINLSDDGNIIIKFDANVVGSTGDCDDCELNCFNYASLEGYTDECPPVLLFREDTVDIKAASNCPPEPQGISGPSSGKAGNELSFESTIVDPDGDEVEYKFKVVGGSETEWIGPVSSGSTATYQHTFEEAGTYVLMVKARDEHGLESGWDVSLNIEISESDEDTLIINPPGFLNLKTVSACIENAGTETLSDVDWEFTISKSGLLGGWEVNSSGTIETLEGESTECVESGPVTLKFGLATITIKATCGDLEDTFTTKAIVAGRLILVL